MRAARASVVGASGEPDEPEAVVGSVGVAGHPFVLYTGIGWEYLPQELGFRSGTTCWRPSRAWVEVRVLDRLHKVLLAELQAAG